MSTETVLKFAAVVVVGFFAGVVGVDLLGWGDPLRDGPPALSSSPSRLPGEYLYLDDERVDAYLGQLKEGIAATETRATIAKRRRSASLGAASLTQVGATLEEQETVSRTVSLRAADRFYRLESELIAAFQRRDGEEGVGLRRIEANASGCARIADPTAVKEGEFIRLLGAQLQLPTYGLALAKVAHAPPFLAPLQQEEAFTVEPDRLARLARRRQRQLGQYVEAFGDDPRLPVRMTLPARGTLANCSIFIPVRYSKLTDAPSLLTGAVTVVGKVVRRLTPRRPEYYDVETAVTYGRALRYASPTIRRVLGLDRALGANAVAVSALTDYPGLVVLPLAMYK